jgi:hypothetical protein
MNKDLENRLLGVAVTKGSWFAAQKYLSETCDFYNGDAYAAISMIEKKNPEIKLPWYGADTWIKI